MNFKNYNTYNFIHEACERASGGTSVLVKNSIPHRQLPLNTNFQAVAVSLTLNKVITICSIYIPPNSKIKLSDLDQLIQQLPEPFLLLGDMNGHHTLWGCSDINEQGELLQQFLENNNLCIFNDKSHTYLHPATGRYSALDLSLCTPSIFLDFQWQVYEDTYGSDHFPIALTPTIPVNEDHISRWKLNKADWGKFKTLCEESIISERTIFNSEDPLFLFTQTVHDIATKCIPKSSTSTKIKKPWFNEDCKKAVRKRKAAVKKFNFQPDKNNLESFRIFPANARRDRKSVV